MSYKNYLKSGILNRHARDRLRDTFRFGSDVIDNNSDDNYINNETSSEISAANLIISDDELISEVNEFRDVECSYASDGDATDIDDEGNEICDTSICKDDLETDDDDSILSDAIIFDEMMIVRALRS